MKHDKHPLLADDVVDSLGNIETALNGIKELLGNRDDGPLQLSKDAADGVCLLLG